ncbi:TetR/AcrR family transcriptional regulator [Nocardia pseudovaccinii]|uniref:TetR/AcrR family transcriptional regulator n=1 Tax=Nocardia pseudovaccinii TaxID=189540 RepID=UPI003D8D4EE4
MLDAATRAMIEQGAGVSIAKIAEAAGVSKSGLLHHFSSREALVVAVVEDANEQFRTRAISNLDLSENHPGKMLRAYIRTVCSPEHSAEYMASMALWAGIGSVPAAVKAVRDDAAWWGQQFILDGLNGELAHIVQRAAEGLATAYAYGDETDDSLTHARGYLLTMTQPETGNATKQ